ncbi:MAG: hypothetical protein LUC49_05555, partial [Prevotella sp.]|nr:hypothetical protein [Prevotella sp.]
MKRFLSLALLALFCLFAYQAKAVTELTLNGTTNISGIGTITCSVTLPSAGSLTITEIDCLYTDEGCSTGAVEGTYTSGSYVYSSLDSGTYYGKVSALGSVDITTSFEASSGSSSSEVSSSYGESLGEMTVGTEDSHASYTNQNVSSGSYYMTYTPTADGTLHIISGNEFVVYADAEGQDGVTGTWEGTTVSYVLTGGTTYYVVFTSGMLEGTVAYSGAWYVEMDTSVSYDFSVVSVTAADGTDLTSNITAEGKLDLAVLEDGMQMVINCTNASGYYLDIVFGKTSDDDNTFLTETVDLLSPDTDGNFTWTGGYPFTLTEGYEYPVVCTLYDGEHKGNSNVIAQATVLTLAGTSENTVSTVTLVSSDPMYSVSGAEVDNEVNEGDDMVVTLTFSDYVNISAEISEGLN